MTLQEALATGRGLRRAGRTTWTRVGACGTVTDCAGPGEFFDQEFLLQSIRLDREDLMATDWEAEDPKATVTYSQFRYIWGKACSRYGQNEGLREFLMNSLGLRK